MENNHWKHKEFNALLTFTVVHFKGTKWTEFGYQFDYFCNSTHTLSTLFLRWNPETTQIHLNKELHRIGSQTFPNVFNKRRKGNSEHFASFTTKYNCCFLRVLAWYWIISRVRIGNPQSHTCQSKPLGTSFPLHLISCVLMKHATSCVLSELRSKSVVIHR